MGGTPKAIGIVHGERMTKIVQHRWRFGEKRVDQLANEIGARIGFQLLERGEIDRPFAHDKRLSRAETWFNASTSRSTRIGLVK